MLARHRAIPVLSLLLGYAALALGQPLPTDPALTIGQLDNGLRYIIRKHNNPPGRAVIWIHFHTGSLNETDPQRGLAHYLEHLAFNGSENFPPGSLVPFFQSLGMTFGRDQNAFTSFEQTTYQLSLPDTKPETLDKAMTYFADVLYRLSLAPKEIDNERQIILEERRRSLSGRQRTMYYVLERIAPGSLYGQRITIGTEETIKSVGEKDFRDYYGKWYGASNATLMVVADTEPADIVAALQKHFASAPRKPRPEPQASGVKAYDKHLAIVASDPEIQSEQLRIGRLEPPRPPTTTVAQYRDDLVARIAMRAFNRRIDARVAAGGTSYLGANVSIGNDVGLMYSAEVSGQPAPGKWREALGEIVMEMQRARAFGLTEREIDDAKRQILTGAERAVETEPTLPASALISRMNGAVTDGEPVMSAAQQLELLQQLLPGITRDEVSQRFAAELDPKAMAFVAVMPAGTNVPTEAELLAAGVEALAVKPEPLKETQRATALMKDLPQAGKVAEEAEHAGTQVWSAWLSNNARVHHRFIDTEKNDVTISISLLGGELLETADNRGITSAAQVAWSRPATRHLSSTDIQDLMTDKKVSVRGGGGGGMGRGRRGGGGGGGGNDAITLTVSGSPEDLEAGMQLAYLLLTEPKIEESAFTQFKTRTRQAIEESMHNPSMFGMRVAGGAPYPPDVARTQPLTVEQVDRLTLEAAQAWLEQLIAKSPIEVVIVGDLAREKTLPLVMQYIAALPQRERVSAELYMAQRKLAVPKGPRELAHSVKTQTPQAFVMSGFYGADERDVADVRALTVATRILSTRMVKEVREEAQLVYSISAGSRAGSTYPGFGWVAAASPTEPAKVPTLVKKLADMYAAFAKDGPTEDELGVAKKQIANTLDQEMRQPGFWSGRLSQLTFRGADLNDIVEAPAAYQALTVAQVRDGFAKYYHPEKSVVVIVQPEAGVSE